MNDEQKEIIQQLQETAENIVEADEAAGSEEGMIPREQTMVSGDVAEDRDMTPPQATDVSGEEIVA